MDPEVRAASLEHIVKYLLSVQAIEGAMVLTSKGDVLASRVPADTDAEAIARDCTKLLDTGAEAVATADDRVRVDVRGTKGSTVVLRVGTDMILAVMTATRTPESVSLEISRAAAELERLA
jgi:predicted regulator of Ras-like GTPase activity (Roadblock/LC7/MglB family)